MHSEKPPRAQVIEALQIEQVMALPPRKAEYRSFSITHCKANSVTARKVIAWHEDEAWKLLDQTQ